MAQREKDGRPGEAGEATERIRVLVVDDDQAVREMVLHVVRRQGWMGEGAMDGLQALTRLQHEAYDVVVTDIEMPRLDGIALLREILRMDGAPATVVHSGCLDPGLALRLSQAGAFRIQLKGGSVTSLVHAIEEAMRSRATRPAPPASSRGRPSRRTGGIAGQSR